MDEHVSSVESLPHSIECKVDALVHWLSVGDTVWHKTAAGENLDEFLAIGQTFTHPN